MLLSRPKEELMPLLLLLAFNLLESTLKRQAGRTPDRTSKLAMLLALCACEHKRRRREHRTKKEKGF